MSKVKDYELAEHEKQLELSIAKYEARIDVAKLLSELHVELMLTSGGLTTGQSKVISDKISEVLSGNFNA